jgi:hypothetical protein
MLKQPIIFKLLPKSIADIQSFGEDISENVDSMDIKAENKKLKETKRMKLNELIRDYEQQLSAIELQYQQELTNFRENHLKSPWTRLLKKYVFHRFKQLKQETLFKMTMLREKFYRRRKHRLKSIRSKTIDVYPQTMVDVSSLPLSEAELSYLSSTGCIAE